MVAGRHPPPVADCQRRLRDTRHSYLPAGRMIQAGDRRSSASKKDQNRYFWSLLPLLRQNQAKPSQQPDWARFRRFPCSARKASKSTDFDHF